MPKQSFISIPLDIPDLRVLQTELTKDGEFVLTVESPLTSTTCRRCPWCDGHPTTTQQLDWYDPNALHTKAYERHLILQLVNSTLSDVEAKEDVTADALVGILDRWIATTVDWDTLEPFATMGIDEIALLKGHRDFVAVISGKTEHG